MLCIAPYKPSKMMLLLQECTVQNDTVMICPLPYFPNIIYFPDELLQANSSFSGPRRLRATEDAAVASINSEDASLRLYLGFVMDKLTSLRNISKTKPNIRLELVPFEFKCDNTDVIFYPTVNPLLKIKVI